MIPIDLDSSSAEFEHIENIFKDTLLNFDGWLRENWEIIKITRIQNYNLYKRYYFAKKRIEDKYQQFDEEQMSYLNYESERLLFHGTNKTPPHIIYNSQEGIDRRFTTAAAYGVGSYFAVISGYSCLDRFVYEDNGEYRILVCRVFVGNYTTKKNLDAKTQSILGVNPQTNLRYDSVTDELKDVKNRQMFVVFKNEQSYPQWEIVFKRKS